MGVKVPFGSPTVTYHGNVKYVYNPEWYPLDFDSVPTNELDLLLAIYPNGFNKLAIYFDTVSQGQYTINWCVGATGYTETHNGGIAQEFAYDYDSVPNAETSLGYKTVLIRVTGAITNFYLVSPSGHTGNYSPSNLLGMICNMPNLTYLPADINNTSIQFSNDLNFYILKNNAITNLSNSRRSFQYCNFVHCKYFDVTFNAVVTSIEGFFHYDAFCNINADYFKLSINSTSTPYTQFMQLRGSIDTFVFDYENSNNPNYCCNFGSPTNNAGSYSLSNIKNYYLTIKSGLTNTNAFTAFTSLSYKAYFLQHLRIYNLKTGTGCRTLYFEYNNMTREAFMDFVTNDLPNLAAISATGALHIEYSLAALQLTSADIAVINALGWTIYT